MGRKISHAEYIEKVKSLNNGIEVLEEYKGAITKILHKCSCGREWKVKPIDITSGHTKTCGHCNRPITNIYIGEIFNEWTVLNIDKNNSENNYKILCKCSCGKTKQYIYAPDLIQGRTTKCRKCADEQTAKKNTYTHEEYIKKLKELGNIVKLKEGQIYIKSYKKIIHICSICGKDWFTTPSSVLQGQTMCKKCANSANESLMAKILKQVLKHHFPNMEWEFEIGFKGEKGRECPYDIYVPELKTIIECQSKYHDNQRQKRLDKKKKEYALNKGYNYIAIDHRDTTPLEAIQIFFPDIKEIPSYVDVTKDTRRTWSLEKAQQLLDEGYTYTEVTKLVGATYNAITHSVNEGKLIKPEYYKKKKFIANAVSKGILIISTDKVITA